METLERDVGCVKFPFISQADLASTNWANGIVFVYQDELLDVGCYSLVGQDDGFIDGSIFSSIVETGAPPGWQMVALADNCDGLSESTVHHEVMHVLSFMHEHSRPDRDAFLDFDWCSITYKDQFDKISMNHWTADPFQFDMSSVMLYCSTCASVSENRPSVTLKDGTVFRSPLRASTVDILEIQYAFCSANYSSNELTHCGVQDNLGMYPPLLVSRICDGFIDCPGGVDEDGTLGECQIDQMVATVNDHLQDSDVTSCCQTYLLDGVEYSHAGHKNGIPFYYSSQEELYLLYVDWMVSWFLATSNDTDEMYYYDENSEASPCPPTSDWALTTVTCLVNGPVATPDGLEEFSLEKTYANVLSWTVQTSTECDENNHDFYGEYYDEYYPESSAAALSICCFLLAAF